MKIKIYYSNCEESGVLELEVKCPISKLKVVEQYIDEFKKKEPFYTSPHNFIEHLKKYGFEAKEVEYDLEIY